MENTNLNNDKNIEEKDIEGTIENINSDPILEELPEKEVEVNQNEDEIYEETIKQEIPELEDGFHNPFKVYKAQQEENIPEKRTNGTFKTILIAGITSLVVCSLVSFYNNFNKSIISSDVVINRVIYNDVKEDKKELNISEVSKKAQESIALITNNSVTVTYDFFYRAHEEEIESAGSGIVIAKDEVNLYILTNYHVVADAVTLDIALNDGYTYQGTIRGYSEADDIALIQIPLEEIKYAYEDNISVINIGNSDLLEVGDKVIAIGNALGFGNTVTTGIISAKDREVTFDDYTTLSLIQTDAAINPGNSGGALLDSNGNLIGINTAKFANEYVEGIGYAIPINKAMEIVEDIFAGKTNAVTEGAALGISGFTVDKETAEYYDAVEGVCVEEILENSGAALSGLKIGDIITKIDNEKVSTIQELQKYVRTKEVGDIVELEVYRNTKEGYHKTEIIVTLGSLVY